MAQHALQQVHFIHDYQSFPFPRKKLNYTAQKLYKMYKTCSTKHCNVILCSDYKIRKLNLLYRKIPKPTDVLSFSFQDQDFLGEIYISLQRAHIQARRYKTTYQDEVKRLFVHGFLHLLGFDHSNKIDRETMEAHEQRYV